MTSPWRERYRPVTIRQVHRARCLMVDGYSMKEAAILIGVRSSDLDRALWSYIDTDVAGILLPAERHQPMF